MADMNKGKHDLKNIFQQIFASIGFFFFLLVIVFIVAFGNLLHNYVPSANWYRQR